MARFYVSQIIQSTYNWDSFNDKSVKAYVNGFFVYNAIKLDISGTNKISVNSLIGYIIPNASNYLYYIKLKFSEELEIIDILKNIVVMNVDSITEAGITFSLKSSDELLSNDIPLATIIFNDDQMPISFNYNYGTSSSSVSGGSLTVGEIDGNPLGININKIIFNGTSEIVTISGNAAYINATPPPNPLGGNYSVVGLTFYDGKESADNINYETVAGAEHDYIVNDGVFNLNVNSFAYASQGILILKLNGNEIAKIDLGNNFVESDRSGGQNMANYNTGIDGFTLSNGVCDFINPYTGFGSLRIVHVDPFGGIDTDQYQEGSIQINIINANLWRQGYNYLELEQTGCDVCLRKMNIFKIFYDIDAGADPNVVGADLLESVTIPKYLSGIKYYGDGTKFRLNAIINNAFNNVYHNSNAPVVINGINGFNIGSIPILYTDSSVSGVSSIPKIGETMNINNYQINVGSNIFSIDAIINLTPRDPYGNYTATQTPSYNYMINSFGIESTRLIEHFTDENYRFPNNANFDVVPTNLTGNFNSTKSLSSLEAGYSDALQVFDIFDSSPKKLIYPNTDYSSMKPNGNPDYSTINQTTERVYYRIFQGNEAHTNGQIAVPGIADADLSSDDIKIYIKVPTKTVWLDLFKDYNPATFDTNGALSTGVDGEGCRVDKTVHSPDIDGILAFTLGSNFASDSSVNYTLFIKVVYKNSTVNKLQSGFGIIDWN